MMFTGDGRRAARARHGRPAARSLDSPSGAGIVGTQDAKIRIMRSEERQVRRGRPGRARSPATTTIEMLPGSPRIQKIEESTALPDAKARAAS